MNKTWTIYRHINKINGKCYIGITCQRYEKCRWGKDGHGYNQPGQKKFWAAIKKYGWNNFEHEILERGIKTPAEANAREIYWISFYDSFRNGYNATIGGSGATGHSYSEEARIKNAETHRGKKFHTQKHSEETKKILSENHKGFHNSPKTEFKKGHVPWLKGKHLPEHVKELLRKANSGRPSWNKGKHGKDNPLSKSIIQYDLDGNFIKEWESGWHIKQVLGFDNSAIHRCCRGEYKKSNGYIWRYK